MGGDHATTLSRRIRGASVVVVSDPDAARAAAVAEAEAGARVIRDGFDVIADPAVDAVVVASPDPTHEALVLACLAAQKPVLCEKPLAPTVEGCLRILDAESALGRRLVSVGFMRRFDPGYLALRAALVAGDVGAPLMIHCVHRNASAPPTFDSEMVIVNSAVHEMDAARFLLDDEIATVQACRRAGRDGRALADPQFLILETTRGMLVDIEVFVNAGYGYDVRAEVVCERGTLTLAPQPPVRARSGGAEAAAFAPDWRPHFAAAYANELQAFVDAAGRGGATGASAFDGYAATATAAAGVRSLHHGGAVAVELVARPKLYRDCTGGAGSR